MRGRLQAAMGAAWRALRAPRPAAGQPDGSGPTIALDYPVHPEPRWGYGRPPHPELTELVEAGREGYAERLRSLLPFVDELAEIPFDGPDRDARWANIYFGGLDAAALYGFLVQRRPATYLEVGAGFSTRFARRAITRHSLPTRIVSLDPDPRATLAGIADEHICEPLERTDLHRFERLDRGDILLVDGSHRSFTNSDATVFFCEILPRLPSGLLVYVDDIFLPWDYPPQMSDRWYSEQYLLAAWLLAGDRLEITLPDFWICTQPDLHRLLAPLWDRFTWAAIATNGTGFWMTVR